MNWKRELHDVIAMLLGPALALRRGIYIWSYMTVFLLEDKKTASEATIETDIPVLQLSFAYPFDDSGLDAFQKVFHRLNSTMFAYIVLWWPYSMQIEFLITHLQGVAVIPALYLAANVAFLATWDVLGIFAMAARGLGISKGVAADA